MKLAILSCAPNVYSTRRLKEAAEARGHTLRIINLTECFVNLSSSNPSIHYRGGEVITGLEQLLQNADQGLIYRQGVRAAIVGRPNVGKSSLLNALIGMERAIVSEVPGTTRDPIDTEIMFEKQRIRLIDTAGIRRRGKVERGIEKYSVLRSLRGIDRADVALLLIDAVDGVTAQDTHVAGYVLERFKSVVVVVNKWDALEKDAYTMVEFTKKVRSDLHFLDYVPVVFISALTHQRIHTVLPTAMAVAEARRHRLSTAAFNDILRAAYDVNQPPSRQGRPLRIYYGTQVDVAPPTFALFVNDPDLVHFSYARYLENQIRRHYEFLGTPIRLLFRPREGRGR